MTATIAKPKINDLLVFLEGQKEAATWMKSYYNAVHYDHCIRAIREIMTLLGEARDHIHHSVCVDGDATHCPACSLESLIDTTLE
jgi:hypothetical protein